jgi:hypothetical protein
MNQLSELDLPAVLSTEKASAYINRKPQTLRKWACLDNAPNGIRPIRINGRLSWKVSDLKALLEGEGLSKAVANTYGMEVGNLDPKDFPSIEEFIEPYPPLKPEEIAEYLKHFPDIDPKQYPMLKALDIKPCTTNQ